MWLGRDLFLYIIVNIKHQNRSQIVSFVLCFIKQVYSISVTAMQILACNGNCLSWPWDNYVALTLAFTNFYVLGLGLEKKVLALAS